MSQQAKIGWVIGDQLDRPIFTRASTLVTGGVGLVRYAWLAEYVNKTPRLGLHHSLFRPWRRYDAVIFLKSMGPKSITVLRRQRRAGAVTFFDANVNYYEASGTEYYDGMLPTVQQQGQAKEMTRESDGVIVDSEFIGKMASPFNDNVVWITDSVRTDLLPGYQPSLFDGGRLRLIWCGEAVKLFELLAMEDVLRAYKDHVELLLVTNSLSALERWRPDFRRRFEALMAELRHTVISWASIEHLWRVFSQGGIVLSPRFLDNTYNLGHTEWKITLGMACGRVALCSPVPSYQRVAQRSQGRGIRVCSSDQDWHRVFDELLSADFDWPAEERAALEVVDNHYATEVIAEQHSQYLNDMLREHISRTG